MYYKLSPDYALRSWKNTGTVLYNTCSKQMNKLSLPEFLLLKNCDGVSEIGESSWVESFRERGIIEPCAAPDEIAPEQRFRSYPNEYFAIVQWAITERCNYNCRHCFMMPPNKNSTGEPSLLQCEELIEQFSACGIPEIYITGGEPLIRKDFLSIIDKLIEKNIRITLISTNGALVTDELLLQIKNRGINPTFVVSFDGVGCHDWIRRAETAEDASIKAIKLIIKHGFSVACEMSVYKGNAHLVTETAQMMRELGVEYFKTFYVANSLRWQAAGENQELTFEEYYDICLNVLEQAFKREWQMDMKLVAFVHFHYLSKKVDILPSKGCEKDHDGTVLCKKARTILFVAGDGRLLPCNPFTATSYGKENWGNAFETPLQSLITESEYLSKVNSSIGMLKELNKKCFECKGLKECWGGCRALAYGYTGDYYAADPLKCAFFEGGYKEKIQSLTEKYTAKDLQ